MRVRVFLAAFDQMLGIAPIHSFSVLAFIELRFTIDARTSLALRVHGPKY